VEKFELEHFDTHATNLAVRSRGELLILFGGKSDRPRTLLSGFYISLFYPIHLTGLLSTIDEYHTSHSDPFIL
jgi:hypothetical protein